MSWLLASILSPLFYAISNHIDKYLLSRYMHNVGIAPLMVFSGLIGLIALPIIVIIEPGVLSTFVPSYLLISINGMLFLLACLPYFKALSQGDSSLVVTLFQMSPVFTYLLGWLVLGESLSINHIIGGAIIIISSIFIVLDLKEIRKIKMRWNIFWYMFLSTVLFALNSVFFKLYALQADFWTANFWEYLGFMIFGLAILVFPLYRRKFFSLFEKDWKNVLGINALNEVMTILGKVFFNFGTLFAPVVLINFIGSLQSMYVFILGILITIFFPRIAQEDISRRTIIQRIIAITFTSFGIYLLGSAGF